MKSRNSISFSVLKKRWLISLILCCYLVTSIQVISVVGQNFPAVKIGDRFSFISESYKSKTTSSPLNKTSKSQKDIYVNEANSSYPFKVSEISGNKISVLYPNQQRGTYDDSVSTFVDRFLSGFLAWRVLYQATGSPLSVALYSPLNPSLFVQPDWKTIAGELSRRLNGTYDLKGIYPTTNLTTILNSVNSFNLFGATSSSQLPQKLNELRNYFRYTFNYTTRELYLPIKQRSLVFELKYSIGGILEHLKTFETISYDNYGSKVLEVNSRIFKLVKSVSNSLSLPKFSIKSLIVINFFNLLILIAIFRSKRRKIEIEEVKIEDTK